MSKEGKTMFGYVRINKMDLTFREFDYYKGYYCGLCKYLKENHGEVSRLSLNYDITFLIVILTALYINLIYYNTLRIIYFSLIIFNFIYLIKIFIIIIYSIKALMKVGD